MITIQETATHLRLQGDPRELNLLSGEFQYRPENYWRSPQYQLWKQSEGQRGWDGNIRLLRKSGDKWLLLRGHLSELLARCDMHGIKTDKTKLLPRPFANLTIDDIPEDLIVAPFVLDYNQRLCILNWLKATIGINQVTVSGGKTLLSLGALSFLKRWSPSARFLYITPTERLVNQVFKEVKKALPDWDISQYGGGKQDKDGKDLVIVTNAMVHRNMKSLLAWFPTFLGVIHDESHHLSSTSNSKVMLALSAFFRFGCSDTAHAESVDKAMKVRGLCGEILTKVEAAPLIQIGRLAKPIIYIVEEPLWKNKFKGLKHAPELDTTAWMLVEGRWTKGIYKGNVLELREDGRPKDIISGFHQIEIEGKSMKVESRWCLLKRSYDEAVIRFQERNDRIVEWVSHYTSQQKQTLVVCTRTLHVLILEAALKRAGQKVRILFGEHSTRERDEAFEWFSSSPGHVLVSPLVREGVSIPEIRAGVIADYLASWEPANQILGRMIRQKPTGDNTGEITWFVENQHPGLNLNSRKMLKKLMAIRGYEFHWPCNKPSEIASSRVYEKLW